MALRNELIEELLAGKDPQGVFSQDGLLDELKKALAERILNAEMDQHLAAERAEADESEARNHRNGHSRKTVLTGSGKLDLQVPRDRQASFEPQLIAKYRRRFPDFAFGLRCLSSTNESGSRVCDTCAFGADRGGDALSCQAA